MPLEMMERSGPHAWPLFRKLVELDCDRNITPDWFSLFAEDLSRWTGLSADRVELILDALEAQGWIERGGDQARIATPLSTPLHYEEARKRLAENQGVGGRFYLRYSEDDREMTKVERVVFMYQMVFGLRFNPRIAEDLEEIANEHDLAVLHDVFSEAHRRNARNLSWVKTRLKSNS